MKLNRKAFTLIELIVVIAVMAILTAIILPNVLKMSDDNKKEQFVTHGKNMLSKAKYLLKIEDDLDNSEIFTKTDNCYYISLEDLGLDIDKDPDDNLYSQDVSQVRACYNSETDNYIYSIVTFSTKNGNFTRGIYNPEDTEHVGYVLESNIVKESINPIISITLYTLTIDPDGGSWSSNAPELLQSINVGGRITIPAPTREGLIFVGWNIEGEGSSISDTTFTMGNEDTSIKALWDLSPIILVGTNAISSDITVASNWSSAHIKEVSTSYIKVGGNQGSYSSSCSKALPNGYRKLEITVEAYGINNPTFGYLWSGILKIGTSVGGDQFNSISFSGSVKNGSYSQTETYTIDPNTNYYLSMSGNIFVSYNPTCKIKYLRLSND